MANVRFGVNWQFLYCAPVYAVITFASLVSSSAAGILLHGVPPGTWIPYPGVPNASPGFCSALGLPLESHRNRTDELAPDSANGLKSVFGAMAVLVAFTAPMSS